MNHLRRVILTVLLTLGTLFTVSVVSAESNQLEDLLPQYNDFKWTYHGIAEYGHEMMITSIVLSDNDMHYSVDGRVYDASGGESNADYSLSMTYIVKLDVIIQEKNEEMMLDSNYDRIELIRGPLEEGTTWTQEVEGEDGGTTTLECTIEQIESDGDSNVYTVLYEDMNSPYYEKREMKENTGIISFE